MSKHLKIDFKGECCDCPLENLENCYDFCKEECDHNSMEKTMNFQWRWMHGTDKPKTLCQQTECVCGYTEWVEIE